MKMQVLDAVRSSSALAVLFVHVLQLFVYRFFGADHFLTHFFGTLATHAVLVFFLLSGYLIVQSILKKMQRNGYFHWQDYAAARIARIYPPFLASLIISAGCYWTVTHFNLPGSPVNPLQQPGFGVEMVPVFAMTGADFFRALALLDGLNSINPPLWSLYIEVRLYLIAGGLVYAIDRRSMVALLFSAALMGWSVHAMPQFSLYAAVWCLAGTFAWLEQKYPEWLHKALNVALVMGLLVLMLLLVFRGILAWSKFYPDATINHTNIFAFALAYAGLLFKFRHLDIPWLRPIARMESWSFSLYVTHCPVLLLVLSLSQPYTGMSVLGVAGMALLSGVAAIAVAKICSSWTEHPMAVKHWLLDTFSIRRLDTSR